MRPSMKSFVTIQSPANVHPNMREPETVMKRIRLALTLALLCVAAGCTTLASHEETGAVIARRAQVRSSTAVVAADLKEVVRGDELDILDSVTAPSAGDPDSGERWLHVRTRDAEPVEGWIEARNVISHEIIERSRQLAKQDENIPAQAAGKVRVGANLRLSPDRNNNDNILLRLQGGDTFDIVGWKRMPPPKTANENDSDDAQHKATARPNNNLPKDKSGEPSGPENTLELWYKVRLSSTTSPVPAGWIFGKQVELLVPSDIIFYRSGREFVAWHRLDNTEKTGNMSKVEAETKVTTPGSWVILEKSNSNSLKEAEETDFDRLTVIGYDKDRQEHYSAYRSADLKGELPLRVSSQGDDFTISINEKDGTGLREARYKVYRDAKGVWKVTPIK